MVGYIHRKRQLSLKTHLSIACADTNSQAHQAKLPDQRLLEVLSACLSPTVARSEKLKLIHTCAHRLFTKEMQICRMNKRGFRCTKICDQIIWAHQDALFLSFLTRQCLWMWHLFANPLVLNNSWTFITVRYHLKYAIACGIASLLIEIHTKKKLKVLIQIN